LSLLHRQMDSPVTERADYFSIALALVYHTSIGFI
jgi:hypothetical protein